MSDREIDKDDEMVIPISGPEDNDEVRFKETDTERNSGSETVNGEYLEQLQRLQAEFHNYKKRVEKERESLYSLAQGDLVFKLLPILDDFERVLEHHQTNDQNSWEGVLMIYKNLNKILSDAGLREVPSVGEPFDPEFHEAVDVEETDDDQDGKVTEEWHKGYIFEGRLIRPSQVKVGKTVDKTGDD